MPRMRSRQERAVAAERVRQILEKDPNIPATILYQRFPCDKNIIVQIRKEMGLARGSKKEEEKEEQSMGY